VYDTIRSGKVNCGRLESLAGSLHVIVKLSTAKLSQDPYGLSLPTDYVSPVRLGDSMAAYLGRRLGYLEI
jgi:hypothetical protein